MTPDLDNWYATPSLQARTVTFLLTDIERSTRLWLTDPDAMRQAVDRHDALVSAAILDWGGTILTERGEGDSIFALFARARDAVAAALAAQRSLTREVWPRELVLTSRMAVHTGEVGNDYRGAEVSRCARLRGVAHGGQVLLSSTTAELVRGHLPENVGLVDLGLHELRDLPGPERVLQLSHPDLPAAFPPLNTRTQSSGYGLDLPFEEPTLAGRDRELQRLGELLAKASIGQGRLVVVDGEPGIGKSRLIDEVRTVAHRQGFLTLMAQCYEEEGSVPYRPLVDLLEGALQVLPHHELTTVLAEGAAEFVKVMPNLRLVAPQIPKPAEMPPEQTRTYLFRAVREVVEQAGRQAPLLVTIDDLHWADPATLLFLQYLAAAIRSMPVLMITTYRDAAAEEQPTLAHALQEVIRRSRAERIHLRPLDTAAVGALLTSLSGRSPPESVVRLIEAQTDGNPLFVEEVYRQLVDQRAAFDKSGRWRSDVAVVDVPASVRLMVGRRLERLTNNTRRIVELLATVGRSSTLSLLQSVSSPDPDTLLDALEEAQVACLVTLSRTGADVTVRFVHELVRQTLLTRLTLLRRQRLHLTVARAIEKLHGPAAHHAAEIAYHLYQAGATADPRKTVEYLRLAAEQALKLTAFEDAVTRLKQALELCPVEESPTRGRLLAEYGRALRSVGQWERALEVWKNAVAVLESLGETSSAAQLCADMAFQLNWGNRFVESVEVAAHGLELTGDQASETRASLLALSGGAFSFLGNHDAALGLLEAANGMAASLDNSSLQARIWAVEATVHWEWSRPRMCVLRGRAAAKILRTTGEPFLAVGALGFVELCLCLMGQPANASRVGAEVERLASRFGHHGAAWLHRVTRLLVAIAGGELESVESLAYESMAWCEQYRVPWVSDAIAFVGLAALWRGNWEAALAKFEQALSRTTGGVTGGGPWACRLLALTLLGDHDQVRRLALEQLPDLPAGGQPIQTGQLMIGRAIVEALPLDVIREQTARLYPLVLDAMAAGSVCSSDLCIMEAIAGRAAAAAVSWNRAKVHFARAMRQADEMPHRVGYAEVRRLYAQSLIEGSRERGDRLAAKLLGQAHDRYMQLGMMRHAAMALQLRDQA
jgi:class 3 adenylate cyclase/tetratricopeptide (TPR) repeat protein